MNVAINWNIVSSTSFFRRSLHYSISLFSVSSKLLPQVKIIISSPAISCSALKFLAVLSPSLFLSFSSFHWVEFSRFSFSSLPDTSNKYPDRFSECGSVQYYFLADSHSFDLFIFLIHHQVIFIPLDAKVVDNFRGHSFIIHSEKVLKIVDYSFANHILKFFSGPFS